MSGPSESAFEQLSPTEEQALVGASGAVAAAERHLEALTAPIREREHAEIREAQRRKHAIETAIEASAGKAYGGLFGG